MLIPNNLRCSQKVYLNILNLPPYGAGIAKNVLAVCGVLS